MALKSELEENPYEPPLTEDFLRTAYEYRDNFENDEDFQEALAVWPRCPECGRRRVTRCPVCKTSGDLFALGDAEFWNVQTDESDGAEPVSCGCSCGSCHNRHDSPLYDEHERAATLDGQLAPGLPNLRQRRILSEKTSDVFDELPERRRAHVWAELSRTPDSDRSDEPNASEHMPEATPVVVCHVCSEAFSPKFPKLCEWCGHDFGEGEEYAIDGTQIDADVDEFIRRKQAEQEEIGGEPSPERMTATLIVLAAFATAAIVYFTLIL